MASPSSRWDATTVRPFEVLDRPILSCRGAIYEGDIFSVLKTSPYVLRSFEFALADGAIDCSNSFPSGHSFADRFWETDQRLRQGAPATELLLFDVKSKISRFAGDQIYLTRVGQLRHVAFYIGLCASDPDFVELFPNHHQRSGVLKTRDLASDQAAPADIGVFQTHKRSGDEREVAVNSSRVSKLPAASYGLDPCNSPYRMRIGLLPEAVRRVRECLRTQQPYINPGNEVSFPTWRPQTTRSDEMLKPLETSSQFTAHREVLEIYRLSKGTTLTVDFLGIQPQLADFKFVLQAQLARARQVFVQHKLDRRDRALQTPLTKVFIARQQDSHIRWHFSAHERFDFLLYQFSFSDHPNPQRIEECFFLPEREIPNIFYETLATEQSFELPHFAAYRLRMDRGGQWIDRIQQIIHDNPEPRYPDPRPFRSTPIKDYLPPNLVPKADPASSGRTRFKDAMVHLHHLFYHRMMQECAKRKSGLLCVLATDHPMGDFVYIRYQWSNREQADYLSSKKIPPPPKTLDHLPPSTPCLSLCLYTRDLESSFSGPVLRASQFRRLNSCPHHRLAIWSLWGGDQPTSSTPVIVIPTEDLCPSEPQRKTFAQNLDKKRRKNVFAARTPTLSHLLRTGLLAADYHVGNNGPLVYGQNDPWKPLWELFNAFMTLPSTYYKGETRDLSLYRFPLRDIHQCLYDDIRRNQENYMGPLSSA